MFVARNSSVNFTRRSERSRAAAPRCTSAFNPRRPLSRTTLPTPNLGPPTPNFYSLHERQSLFANALKIKGGVIFYSLQKRPFLKKRRTSDQDVRPGPVGASVLPDQGVRLAQWVWRTKNRLRPKRFTRSGCSSRPGRGERFARRGPSSALWFWWTNAQAAFRPAPEPLHEPRRASLVGGCGFERSHSARRLDLLSAR